MNLLRCLSIFTIILVAGGCANVQSQKSTFGFAAGDLIEGVPVGWSGTSGDPEKTIVGADRSIVHGGSVSFAFLSEDDDYRTSFSQSIEVGQYVGEKVRFQAYVRTNRVRGTVALWLRADSKKRQAVAFDNMAKRRISGTTEWELYTIVLEIPKDTLALHYGIMLEGSGQVWIDDCSVDIVGDDVWVTARNGTGFARKYKAPRRILSYPANLGFEGRPESN